MEPLPRSLAESKVAHPAQLLAAWEHESGSCSNSQVAGPSAAVLYQLSLLVLDPSHYKNKRKWNFFTVVWVLKIDQFKLEFGMWNASYLAQIVQKLVEAHTTKRYNLVM